ncbi:MAG: zinc-dependent metalloprotease [Actinomycetota bacterium]|nr:zinc-dependent metalloprotease [Actinomycetota bacterium]
MLDRGLALEIARLAAGPDPHERLPGDLDAWVARAEAEVGRFTGLAPTQPLPAPEPIARDEWAAINVDLLAELLTSVTERLERRLERAGPLAGPMRIAAKATLAAEMGLVVGFLSGRVLGQYELSLLGHERPPRLLFVSSNVVTAAREMGVHGESFLAWIALHEVTHAFQFAGVPWLRGHLGGLLERYLATVDVRIRRGSAGGVSSLPDPAKLIEAFREGGLAALVQTREQRAIMDGVQAAMSVVEGYSEHVMDALGAEVVPGYTGLREAMERRRANRSAPERVIGRLLGLDMKMRQYELGRRFCGEVADRAGMAGLNRVWDSAGLLPTLAELEAPAVWLSRVERERALSA